MMIFDSIFTSRKEKKLARIAASWWAGELDGHHADRRVLFEESLYNHLLKNEGWDFIGNDYDPSPILIDAVRDAGICCDGYMFSGDGIFPRKTSMFRQGTMITVKVGYGATPIVITPIPRKK